MFAESVGLLGALKGGPRAYLNSYRASTMSNNSSMALRPRQKRQRQETPSNTESEAEVARQASAGGESGLLSKDLA